MVKSLEKSTEIVDVSFEDMWVPFKYLRHIPTILKYENNFLKSCDLVACGVLTAFQFSIYYNGIKMFM